MTPGARRLRAIVKTTHLWLGLSLGTLLALVTLSGSVLLFDTDLFAAEHPELVDRALPGLATQGRALQTLLTSAAGRELRSLSFPSVDLPAWNGQARNGDRIYFDAASGDLLLRRPASRDVLLILKDWHTHLLTGDIGETVLGVVAATGLIMLISGAWLYWPGRQRALRHLRPHVRPPTLRWASFHRFAGIVGLPLLVVMIGTGTAMAYRGAVRDGLAALFHDAPHRVAPTIAPLRTAVDWPTVLTRAQTAVPGATLTRLTLPTSSSGLLTVRVRQPGTWNPAGHTSLWLDPATATVLGADDTAHSSTGNRLSNSLFPIHSAAVGGMTWRLIACATGLLPTFLLVTGFLFWRARRRRPASSAMNPAVKTAASSRSAHPSPSTTR